MVTVVRRWSHKDHILICGGTRASREMRLGLRVLALGRLVHGILDRPVTVEATGILAVRIGNQTGVTEETAANDLDWRPGSEGLRRSG